ncbi:hypothetical protein [Candidatus Magnetomonas plexicatena]|uniref:hypothetical protein n=1 Tax=Candidatus Magnetomonas plexicatena TaxID=2552947 RepID=UPI00110014AA|nr:hypothetical protein E2O03_006330 [Nitrospirales bacterium LBB_01]
MVNSVSNATTSQQVNTAQSKPKSAAADTEQAKPKTTPSATVSISAAAAALQEATETPNQTAKEARGGDQQAKRLLAKEAAQQAAANG